MGKKKVASSYIFGDEYKSLSKTPIIEDLKSPSQCAYPLSNRAEEYGKLIPKLVYRKILDGEFLISHPEKTKTSRAIVSRCWGNGMKLLLERNEVGKFFLTGWIIHQAHSCHGVYCG